MNILHFDSSRLFMFMLLTALLLALSPPAAAQSQRCGNSGNYRGIISSGTFSGKVDEGPWDTFCFDAERGDTVTIETWRTSGSLIPALYLHDNRMDTYQLADDQNPDGGDSASISNFVIPETARYLISAGRVCCGQGNYQMRLEIESSAPPDRGTHRGWINYGDRVRGWIGDGNWYEDYRFNGASGDIVAIAMNRLNGDLDSVLELYDSRGNEIADNDDGGSGNNALIDAYRLPRRDEYRIRARRYHHHDGSTAGDYELTLRRESRPPPRRDPGKRTLSYGGSLTGYLDSSNIFDDFLFSARSGDIVTIALNRSSGDLDPMLRLYNSSARELASNDDGGPGNNALIDSFRIPSSGDYTIHALRYGSSQSGGYSISLSRSSSSRSSRSYGGIVVDSHCSLADAIRSANRDRSYGGCDSGSGADTISLAESVNLRSELPRIESRITIEGNGYRISGRGEHRIFYIESYGELTINDASLEDGYAADDGELNLIGDGGAILNLGLLRADRVAFRSNISGEDGGAVRNLGEARFTDSSFINNRAQRQAGAIYSADSSASGPDSARLTIDAVEFSGNESARHGGAIFMYGQATIDDSDFSSNTAQISGGALYSVGRATVRRTDFRRNRSYKNGGAIFNDYEAQLTISTSEFSDNSTRTGGGGVASYGRASATISGSRFTGNSASQGGGVFVKGFRRGGRTYYGELSLRDNSFSNNRGGDCVIGEYGDLRLSQGNRFSDGGCRS